MTEIVFDGEIRSAWRGNKGKDESTAGKPFFYCNFLKETCGNFTAVSRMIERRARYCGNGAKMTKHNEYNDGSG